MGKAFAYLADGKLYCSIDGGSTATLIDSPFVEQIRDREARSRERQGWKSGMTWFSAGSGSLLPNAAANAANPNVRQVRFSGVCTGPTRNDLIYAIDTGAAGGLFQYEVTVESERRMIHKAGFNAADLRLNADRSRLALAISLPDGASNIGMMELAGRGIREITDGDSLDQAPSWDIGGKSQAIVFQSAGIGRNAQGAAVSQGPYAIMRLNLDAESLDTLVEDEAFDFLTPKYAADGALLYIRRPYTPRGQESVNPWKAASDILLFPFRFVRAIVHFLDWFSMVFARKPMITASGPRREGPDQRYVMLWGKLVDAEKAIRQAKHSGNGRSLVPKSWQLVRRDPQGPERVLAEAVISFDLSDDGSVIYTDGSNIFRLSSSGQKEDLASGKVIEQVIAME